MDAEDSKVAVLYGEAKFPPPACLVACIGEHFQPGVQEGIMKAVVRAREMGIRCEMFLSYDMCVTPFHGLGAMRNKAFTAATKGGFDYLLIADNDILLEDTEIIPKLMACSKHIVVPMFDQRRWAGNNWQVVSHPMYAPGQGLQRLDWIAVNCIMFDMALFRLLGPIGQRIFTDPMVTNEEDYIFGWLASFGVQLWQDTDCLVTMLRPPTKFWEESGGRNPRLGFQERMKKVEDVIIANPGVGRD